MRRILVEKARRKGAGSAAGDGSGASSTGRRPASTVGISDELLALDEALTKLGGRWTPQAAELVKLRYFAGLTVERGRRGASASRPRTADRGLGLRPGLAARRDARRRRSADDRESRPE